jgi:hypothetical protein
VIHRLITSLTALAAGPAESARDDFEDALLLVRQCQSLHLTPAQSAALDRLERCLSLPSSSGKELRAHASAALSVLRPEAPHC